MIRKNAGWLLPILAAAALVLAVPQNSALVRSRERYRLVQAGALENTPPLVTFTTVALGGFRGVLVDILWIRAAQLQTRGKYFELVQLADWITKLEPRSPHIWAYHAWNLAYNVSVMMSDPADRWRWVRHGIELLRNEGLHYNPGSARLYRELAWLFWHKIGDDMDAYHWYFKRQWAFEMEEALARDADLLKSRYRMDPDIMRALEEQYGAIDWRLPAAQTLYWASRGRPYAEEFEQTQLQRLVFHSLARLFRKGRLILNDGAYYVTVPQLDLLDAVRQAFREREERYQDDYARTSYRNFLSEAVMIMFAYGRMDEARSLFEAWRERSGEEAAYDNLQAFVDAWPEQALPYTRRDVDVALIHGALAQAAEAERAGRIEEAEALKRRAETYWDAYTKDHQQKDLLRRMGLPPLEVLEQTAHVQRPMPD